MTLVQILTEVGQALLPLVIMMAGLGVISWWIFSLEKKDKEKFRQRALVETSQLSPLLMQDITLCKTSPRLCLKIAGKFSDDKSCVLELRVPEECVGSTFAPLRGFVRVSQQVHDFVNAGEYIIVPATHCIIDNRRHVA